jgi:hypothetical protein
MRRRLSCFHQVACGFLILPTILLAQHQGPTMPLVRNSPVRTFTPPSAPLLWGRSGPAAHPGPSPSGGRRHEDGHHGTGYGAPYPYFFGYGLPFPYGTTGDAFAGPEQDSVNAATPVAPSAGASQDAGPEFANNAPPLYRPLYQEPPVEALVHPQPTTTLIFKDGRPSKQVHNYALTAKTLYALDGDTRQEIPLSLLDVQATIDANRAAGVDFALPVSR